jgi:peptidoglycan/xylan/chitin deacetylase (PgdA/CDA1 family)
MVAAGHEIGLHGDDHLDLSRSSPRTLIVQIHRARARLEQLLGREVRYFRPPYGTQNLFSYLIARASGLDVVAWSASPRDFLAIDLHRQVQVALDELRPGGILLLHDGGPSAPARRRRLVEQLLEDASATGLSPVTVSELLARGESVRRVWLRGRSESLIEEVSPFLVVDGS